MENGCCGELVFEQSESTLCGRIPLKRNFGRGKFGKQKSNPTEVTDESSVEICEAQEALQLPTVGRNRPFHHRLHLLQVGP